LNVYLHSIQGLAIFSHSIAGMKVEL